MYKGHPRTVHALVTSDIKSHIPMTHGQLFIPDLYIVLSNNIIFYYGMPNNFNMLKV